MSTSISSQLDMSRWLKDVSDANSPRLADPAGTAAKDAKQHSDLESAARQFESLLVREVFRAMRKTVPKSSLIDGGFSEQVFTDMFDEAVAQQASQQKGLGLAEVLVEQMGGTPSTITPTVHRRLLDGSWHHPLGKDVDSEVLHEHMHTGQSFGAYRAGDRPDSCGQGHCGIDFAQPEGTPVYAANEGVVVGISNDIDSEGGLSVVLAHRSGGESSEVIRTRYLHLSAVNLELKVGQNVSAGMRIGDVGDTGTASQGEHLHFEVSLRTKNQPEEWIDPKEFLKHWSQ